MVIAAALLAAGIATLEEGPARRLGAAGLVALALGIAASGLPAPSSARGFLAVNAGLILLGTTASVAALVLAARQARGAGLLGPLVGAAGGVLALADVARAAARAGWMSAAVAIALGLVAGGWVWLRRRAVRGATARGHPPGLDPRWPGLLLVAVGALAAGLGRHIGVLLTGAAINAWGAWLVLPRTSRPLPYAPVALLGVLAATLWLLAAIAGPEGLALAAIPSLPLSVAAERLVALLLAAAAWILSGLVPWRQPAGGALTAQVACWMLVRLGIPAVPAGLEHWRPALFPLAVVSIWSAGLAGRLSSVAVAGAVIGVASLEPAAIRGAGLLLAAAVALEARLVAPPLLRAGAAAAAAWGAIGVLGGGLRAEVVYTVVACIGAAVALTPPAGRSIFGPETR